MGTKIYYLGGYCSDNKSYHNSLNVLDVRELEWSNINSGNSATSPMKKGYCGMINIGDQKVLVVGGRGIKPRIKPPDFQYIEGKNSCMTNEQHICQLSSGMFVTSKQLCS